MTERLYYKDSSLLSFDAEIIDSYRVDNKHQTLLNRSAFYPTSGGQLFDRGTINSVEIENVIETDSGDVAHVSTTEIGKKGESVKGEVDKTRRWDNRQKHTAQHIISQVFIRQSDLETVSVHLGENYGAIELATDEVSDSQLTDIEKTVNELIRDNLKVEILFADHQELGKFPLRKIPERKGLIRIIKIGEFDYSACGGTHCDSLREIVLIKFIGAEKVRKNILIKFLAGRQALEDYSQKLIITNSIANRLTCHVDKIEENITKLHNENKTRRKQITALSNELLPVMAGKLTERLFEINNLKIIFETVSLVETKMLGQLASLAAKKISGLAILICRDKIVFAAANDKFDAREISTTFSEKFDLRGGGNSSLATYGGVDNSKVELYKKYVTEILSNN